MSHLTLPALKVRCCLFGLESAFIPFYPRRGQLVRVDRDEIPRTGDSLCLQKLLCGRAQDNESGVDFYHAKITVLRRLNLLAVGCQRLTSAVVFVVICPRYFLVSLHVTDNTNHWILSRALLVPSYRNTAAATAGTTKIQPRAHGVQRGLPHFLPFVFFTIVPDFVRFTGSTKAPTRHCGRCR
jgi:hypothetical protein